MTGRIVARTVFCLLTVSVVCRAQSNPNFEQGLTPFENFHGGDIDRISLSTGNLYVHIPLIDYPQRGGKLKLSFSLQSNNKAWYEASRCNIYNACTYYWTYSGYGIPPAAIYAVDDQRWTGGLNMISPCNSKFARLNTIAYSPDGGSHPQGVISGTLEWCPKGTPIWLETADGTGVAYTGPNTGNNNGSLITRDGVRHFPGLPSTPVGTDVLREDPSGDQISEIVTVIGTASNGAAAYTEYYLDTVGRRMPAPPLPAPSPYDGLQNVTTTDFSSCTGPLPIYSAVLWSPPGPSGGAITFKFCYAYVALQTNFQTAYQEYSGDAVCLQSVVLPDGTAWTFEYNSRSPGDPSNVNYGDLTKITFPTGGSISYSYANVSFFFSPIGNISGANTPLSRTIVSRTVDAGDGTGPHTWNYQWGPINTATTPNTMTNVETDPLGNATVYTNAALDTWRETVKSTRGHRRLGPFCRLLSQIGRRTCRQVRIVIVPSHRASFLSVQ